VAKLTGDRKVETVPLKEVQPLTGYVRGGATVLGAKKAYPVYVDETIELFEVVSVSAGSRGLQVLQGKRSMNAVSSGMPKCCVTRDP
jgi:Cys-tRNA(Pro)/Cys-tRNA(Cys) deacylase